MRYYTDEKIKYLITQVSPFGLWEYCKNKKYFEDMHYIDENYLKHE